MAHLYGTVNIWKYRENPDQIKSALKTKFTNISGEININEHCISFKTKITLDDFESDAPNYDKIELMKDEMFDVKICKHGFVLFQLDRTISPEQEEVIESVFHNFENNLSRISGLFDYDKTLSSESKKTFTDFYGIMKKDGVIQTDIIESVLDGFVNTMKDILEMKWNEYEKGSISMEDKQNGALSFIRVYRLIRGYYLRLFNLGSRCDFIEQEITREITNDLGNVLEHYTDKLEQMTTNSRIFNKDDTNHTGYFIFMDIIDFTLHVERKFSSNAKDEVAKLDELTKLISQWLQQNKIPLNAYWMKGTGDGCVMVFTESRHPYELAKFMQTEENKEKVQVRIGLNAGEVFSVNDLLEREDMIGPGINNAERVMSMGNAGHILASSTIYEILVASYGNVPGVDLKIRYDKHGNQFHVYNLYTEKYGNADVPPPKHTKKSD